MNMFAKLYFILLVGCSSVEIFGQTHSSNRGTISCYTGTKIEAGRIKSNTEKVSQCGARFVCAKVTATAVVSIPGTSSLSGTIAHRQCISSSLCSLSTCGAIQRLIPQSVPIALRQCSIECCDKDLCNRPDHETTQTTASPPTFATTIATSGRVLCSTGTKVWAAGSLEFDSQTKEHCAFGSQCLDFSATIHARISTISIPGRISYRSCVPSQDCGSVTCALVQAALPENFPATIGSCDIKCCNTDRCQTTTTTTTAPFKPIIPRVIRRKKVSCYRGIKAKVTDFNYDTMVIETCDLGSRCLDITASVTIRNFTGKISIARCVPSAVICQPKLCQQIQSFLPKNQLFSIQGCNVSCCKEDHCNRPFSSPTPTPTPTLSLMSRFNLVTQTVGSTSVPAPASGAIACYTGSKTTTLGYKQNLVNSTQCSSDEICYSILTDATASIAGASLDASVYVGQCVQRSICPTITCNYIQSFFPKNIPLVLKNCSRKCCSSDYCNSPPQDTSSTKSPSDASILCFTGVRYNGVDIENIPQTTECNNGFTCMEIDSVVTTNTNGIRTRGHVVGGQCVPASFCNVSGCDFLKKSLPASLGVEISECRIKCCDGNLCNQPKSSKPASTTQTTEPVTSTTTTTTTQMPSPCGPTHLTATGISQKFKFPIVGSHYKNNMDCAWTMTTYQPDQAIRITFKKFNTEKCCDYLQIMEAGQRAQQIKGKYRRQFNYKSNGNRISLKFKSDSSIVGDGFELSYQAVSPDP